MIDDMMAVMRRINDLQKRFGLKRHNPEINLQQNVNKTGKDYLQTHNDSIKKAVNPTDKSGNSEIKMNNYENQNVGNYNIMQSINEFKNNSSKKGLENLMNLMPGSIKEYSGDGSLYSPSILTKGMSVFNNLVKQKNINSNVENKNGDGPYFNTEAKNNIEKNDDIRKGINSYLKNIE